MSRGRWLVLAVLAAAVANSLAAQHPTSVFDHLQGTWRGDGTLMGRPAQFTMTWESSRGFAVLRFGNGFVDSTGGLTPVLNAAAVYRTTGERHEGVWLDSRGVRVEIRWAASDTALVADWTAPGEAGRTTYRVVSPDSVEVIDEVRSGDVWRTFGAARYRRRR